MKKSLYVLVVLIIVVAVILLFKEKKPMDTVGEKVSSELEKERLSLQQKNADLEKRLSALKEELASETVEVPEEKIVEVFGEEVERAYEEKTKDEEISLKANNFFKYIDKKEYLPAAGINMKASDYCMTIFSRLEKNRPVLVGETKDLYALIKNITFFFRVLGEKDLKALKIILENESEIMEQTAGMFYSWICEPENKRIGMPSQDMIYDYAAYFLNTIAGQAYLFRRGSKIRLLTSYYAVLVLDKVDRDGRNSLGIDVRPHIVSLISEIENYRLFVNGKDYLENLRALKKRYDDRAA
jgi:hypothetical protein